LKDWFEARAVLFREQKKEEAAKGETCWGLENVWQLKEVGGGGGRGLFCLVLIFSW
jgi:hypothetical protein